MSREVQEYFHSHPLPTIIWGRMDPATYICSISTGRLPQTLLISRPLADPNEIGHWKSVMAKKRATWKSQNLTICNGCHGNLKMWTLRLNLEIKGWYFAAEPPEIPNDTDPQLLWLPQNCPLFARFYRNSKKLVLKCRCLKRHMERNMSMNLSK